MADKIFFMSKLAFTFISNLLDCFNTIISILNKSEREGQILCINTYVWVLERRYWWTYLQGSSRDADTENRLVDMGWEGDGGTNRADGSTHITTCRVDGQGGSAAWHRELNPALSEPGGVGWGGRREGGIILMPVAEARAML